MDGHHVPLGHTFGVSIRWSPGTDPWLPQSDAGTDATVVEVLRLLEEERSRRSNLPPSEGLPVHTIVGHRLSHVDPEAQRGFLSIRTSCWSRGSTSTGICQTFGLRVEQDFRLPTPFATRRGVGGFK